MLEAKEYNIDDLGERKRAIPSAEPKLITTARHIPVSEPDLNPKAKEYVNNAIDSTWISSRGEYLDRFEKEFAEKVGAKYAVAVNSGTSALHLAVATLGIEPHKKVITPTFTMASTAFSISYNNLHPVWVDSDRYYQMDVDQLETALQTHDDVGLIMPVHIYGHPVDCDRIEELGQKYGVPVVYDGAESHGALYKGKPLGNRGMATCYSFYANKIVTTGEGGMVVSDNKEFIDIARNLKDVAFSTERHFWHKRLGYNFRMTNLCGAIGCAQTENFDHLVEQHIANANRYKEKLAGMQGLTFAPEASWAKNVYWMFGIEIDQEKFGIDRNDLRRYLASEGIETRTYFVPMHLQPYYYEGPDIVYPMAERLSERGMYLPSSSRLTPEQIDTVAHFIGMAYVHNRS